MNAPAMTYSRPRRTTIGPGCLTAVFGMGTGVAIRVCSPGYARVSRRQRQELPNLHMEPAGPGVAPGRGVNAVKRSAVSTG